MIRYYFIALLIILSSQVFVSSISQHPVVFIISYDAFRYDYVDKGKTPTLAKLRNEGTHAPYMENVFITKTFTNHFSIATGLYPEQHGVLGNSFFDPLYNKELKYSYEMWHYSDAVSPVWIANEMKGGGRHSGVMMWPGNEFNYSGIHPTYSKAWDNTVKWTERVDEAVQWILNPDKPANLVLMYIEEPDAHSHAFGPDSREADEMLHMAETITKYIVDKLKAHDLLNHVNLFFLSDHGMESVSVKDVIDLREYVTDEKYDHYEGSPTLHIYPKKGEASSVYSQLQKAAKETKKFQVYKKENLPDRWRYRENRRTPPIMAVASPPYVFHDFYSFVKYQETKFNFTANAESRFGVHGYDNASPNMRPYFIAVGPAIKQHYVIAPFETIDLFSLWAHLGGFSELALKTNASFDRVSSMLRTTPSHATAGANIAAVVLGVLFVGTTMGVAVYFMHRKLQARRRRYCERFDPEGRESRQRLLESVDSEEQT